MPDLLQTSHIAENTIALQIKVAIRAFFVSQKMFKSKVLFLSEKRYICQNQVISANVMTHIFDPKKCNKFL